MLLLYFALVGVAASRAVRWPGLLLIVSVLALAIGVEGTLYGRELDSVLIEGSLMLMTVEGAYVVAALLWANGAQRLAHWKA